MRYSKRATNVYFNKITKQRNIINEKASQKKWESDDDFSDEFNTISNIITKMKNEKTVKDLFLHLHKWTFNQCYPGLKK